jgi:hypothetical protein
MKNLFFLVLMLIVAGCVTPTAYSRFDYVCQSIPNFETKKDQEVCCPHGKTPMLTLLEGKPLCVDLFIPIPIK